MLQTITAHDGVAASCAATVKAALAAALPTAAEYLALYEQYAPLVKLDVPKWIEEYEASEKSIAEMRADVTKELAKAAAAEEAIPLTMSLGLFTVSCAAVRKFVVDHHRNLALEIPKVLARRVRAKGDALKEQVTLLLPSHNPACHPMSDPNPPRGGDAVPGDCASPAQEADERRGGRRVGGVRVT